MKVRMIHSVRIKRGKEHVTLPPGTEDDLPKGVAEDLITSGAAEPCTADVADAGDTGESGDENPDGENAK